MRTGRIRRADEENLHSLEEDMSLLRRYLEDLNKDPAVVKDFSVRLRSLLCSLSGTEGSLWRLMEQYEVPDEIYVHAVGKYNLDHPLAKGLVLSVSPIERPNDHTGNYNPAQLYSFKGLFKQSHAVCVLGRGHTYEELIRMVADQRGAHEDEGLSPAHAKLREVLMNGMPAYLPAFSILGEICMELGERVLRVAEQQGAFKRHYHSVPYSIVIATSLKERPMGVVPIGAATFYAAGVTFNFSLTPQSFVFDVQQGETSFEISTPLPESWNVGEVSTFCLVYDHKNREAKTMSSNGAEEAKKDCDLGFLCCTRSDGGSLQRDPKCEDYVDLDMTGLMIYARELSPQEVSELPSVLKSPPEIKDDP